MNSLTSQENADELCKKINCEDAYFKSMKIDWDIHHDPITKSIVNYDVEPTIDLQIVFPFSDNYISLTLSGVRRSNFDLHSDIELKLKKFTSYFQVYLNPENEYQSNFIECREVKYALLDYIG